MISYIGGKSNIGKWIKDYVPRDIETYVETFGGMFWVFFNLDHKYYHNLKTVVYNDFNQLNTNLFECARHPRALFAKLCEPDYAHQQKGVKETPPEFEQKFIEFRDEIFAEGYEITDPYETACKYAYVLTQVFSGTAPEKATFMDYKGEYTCKLDSFKNKLYSSKWQEMFSRITNTENLDFQEVIEKYDSPTTYFYVDPPYWKTENYYSAHDFDRDDHERLANCLKKSEGKWSLSYYAFDLLEQWFPKYKYLWETKEFQKLASTKKEKSMGEELLVLNYDKPFATIEDFFVQLQDSDGDR